MKLGIVGLGHLGKIHLKLAKELKEFEVTRIFDVEKHALSEASQHHRITAAESYDDLLNHIEALIIVTPTSTHYELAAKAIKLGKHVFIEKPATVTAEETSKLIKLAREAGVIVQVGHVERYNPAFTASKDLIKNPYLIEAERLAYYNVRGTDVSVVFDLMIHDIDLVLSLVKSKVKRISATVKTLVSQSADIASALIEFENGCMAKLTANRISQHNIRKLDVFQGMSHIYIDLLNKTSSFTEIIPLTDHKTSDVIIDTGKDKPKYEMHTQKHHPLPENAIKMELQNFYKSIRSGNQVVVSLSDAEAALIVAEQIEAQINY